MVGDPKHLSDLARIEAAVRVTCRACGHQRQFGRNELAGELMRRRRNSAWEMIPDALKCRCGAKHPRLLVLPFADRD